MLLIIKTYNKVFKKVKRDNSYFFLVFLLIKFDYKVSFLPFILVLV